MLWKDNQIFCDVPLPKVEDRPLIVSHPGAHMNYLAYVDRDRRLWKRKLCDTDHHVGRYDCTGCDL